MSEYTWWHLDDKLLHPSYDEDSWRKLTIKFGLARNYPYKVIADKVEMTVGQLYLYMEEHFTREGSKYIFESRFNHCNPGFEKEKAIYDYLVNNLPLLSKGNSVLRIDDIILFYQQSYDSFNVGRYMVSVKYQYILKDIYKIENNQKYVFDRFDKKWEKLWSYDNMPRANMRVDGQESVEVIQKVIYDYFVNENKYYHEQIKRSEEHQKQLLEQQKKEEENKLKKQKLLEQHEKKKKQLDEKLKKELESL